MRGFLAAAAAFIVAVGGSVAVSAVTSEHPQPAGQGLELVSAHRGDLTVSVKYGEARWGTAMWVKVDGVREWSDCKFWVSTANGHELLAGGWLVGPNGDGLWYPTRADVQTYTVTGFVLTSDGKVLMRIPAS